MQEPGGVVVAGRAIIGMDLVVGVFGRHRVQRPTLALAVVRDRDARASAEGAE